MSALYTSGKTRMLTGDTIWTTDTIKCALIEGYSFSADHETITSLTGSGGSVVATSDALTCTAADGVADCDDIIFQSVAAGSTVVGVLLFHDGATDDDRYCIAYVDNGFNLPLDTEDSDITIIWSEDGVFSL